MIAAFKDDNKSYLVSVPYFTNLFSSDIKELAQEENINIVKINGTNILVGASDIGLEIDLVRLNTKLFNDGIDMYNIVGIALALKDIFNDYDLLDDGKMNGEMIICDEKIIYKIGTDFSVVRINSFYVTKESPTDFNYVRTLMDLFEGSKKEKFIKTIKLLFKEYNVKNSKIYMLNTVDDEVEEIAIY